MTCEHEAFIFDVQMGRITKEEGGPVEMYVMDISCNCKLCGLPFIPNWTDTADPNKIPLSIDGQKRRPWVSGLGTILGCSWSPAPPAERWMEGNVPTSGSA